jgi:phage tail protein X
MVYERITIMGEQISLSLIVWRRFHRPMPGLVELTMDLNQELGELGYYLPVGTSFLLPIPIPRGEAVLDPIKLW